MIGRIRGVLLEKRPPRLLLDVHGVGYELEAPMTTFYKLPVLGEEVSLYTHLVLREDTQLLFGFAAEEERRLFRALLRVNGVGAKMALIILSGIESNDFAACVKAGDSARLTRLPGVGKKTAERLIVEMRDRLADWQMVSPAAAAGPGSTKGPAVSAAADAVRALIALGYKPQEASRYVVGVNRDGLSTEEIIREALKASAKN
ncbi:MAG: Holliday junction branch migration protein RuvA [Gammaproteobacteria bacterium]|nr:Holliday junction branch migration protein RuvA [Gammaproteobacteria bacterium]MCI0590783.1 Holliday junction branch migration protein RuvA [Gammaproteobacteria bacterium]